MEDREYLLHVERAIREIESHTSGFSREAYERDSKTQRAVERNLQIIGDAVNKISKAFKDSHLEVEWEEIYAARNIVVHHYFGVDNKIVWDILLEDIPRLKAAVATLLGADA
jgi:uncharacterized protein with HEPN domain